MKNYQFLNYIFFSDLDQVYYVYVNTCIMFKYQLTVQQKFLKRKLGSLLYEVFKC